MPDSQLDILLKSLREIQDNQQRQLSLQAEALEIQKKQVELVQKQFERAERLQARAELIQDKGAQLVGAARKSLIVVIPIIVLLIIYLSWLLFRWL